MHYGRIYEAMLRANYMVSTVAKIRLYGDRYSAGWCHVHATQNDEKKSCILTLLTPSAYMTNKH